MAQEPANSPERFDELSEEQQNILVGWCLKLDKIKSINKRHSSYGLKHMFERSKDGFYIYNGAFKGAMLKAGFDYQVGKNNSPNWYFNISEKSIKDLI